MDVAIQVTECTNLVADSGEKKIRLQSCDPLNENRVFFDQSVTFSINRKKSKKPSKDLVQTSRRVENIRQEQEH
jgi:hypothetical protein